MHKKTLILTELSVLTALILLMAFTPLGYIKTAGLEITLITVPVIIGAVILGEKAGAFLGLVFGVTSFLQAVMGTSPFGVAMLTINPVYCFIVAVPTRVLMGYLTGLIYKPMKKKIRIPGNYIAGLFGALCNTVLFMTALMICFRNADLIRNLETQLGTSNVFAFVIAFVGFNGLVEAIGSTILSGTICTALQSAHKSIKTSE